MTAPVVRTVHVPATPQRAFQVFTDGIGGWWPLPTHSLGGDAARTARFVDGLLVELDGDGERQVWGEVVAWEPPARLSVTFHPGREAGTQVDVEFAPDGDGTRVVLTHHGWEQLGAAAGELREAYDAPHGWTSVLALYVLMATGGGARLDQAEALRARYGELASALARVLGDGPVPVVVPEGTWTPLWVAAHIVANDRIMGTVMEQVVHGLAPHFPGHHSQSPELLERTAREIADDPAGHVRRSGARLVALVAGLSDELLAVRVPARVDHEGHTILDEEVPLAHLVTAQEGRHLQMHVEQVLAAQAAVG